MLQARILLWTPVTLCGAFQEAGKGPLSKGCVFPWVPAPLGSPVWCHSAASCSEGLAQAGHTMAFDLGTILNEKAGTVHTET